MSTIDLPRAKEIFDSVYHNVRTVIMGKETQIRQAMCCWMAQGHLLIEDVPGTGKTILARALSGSIQVPFNRVQFTPDLLPGDIIGSSIYRQNTGEFEFVPGPLFTSVLLGDEINRATPRTQSALLEAMSEGQITAEGKTYKLDSIFFTIATQNPVDQLGTFPLPEAQMDRFMMRLSIGYPSIQDEIKMLEAQNTRHPINTLTTVKTAEDWTWLMDQVHNVQVAPTVYDYIMQIITRTRQRADIRVGGSPRAAIALKRLAQATALASGTDFVNPGQVFDLIVPVLSHRLILSTEAKLANKTALKILEEIKQDIKVPIRK